MANEPKFIKSPAFKGKHLSLHVSGASRTIFDGVVLVGAQWQKFVKLGFLVPLTEENAPEATAPTPVPPVLSPPVQKAVEELASEPVVPSEIPPVPEVVLESLPVAEAMPAPIVPPVAPKKSLDELLSEGETEEKSEEAAAEVDGVTRSTAGKMMKAASKRRRRSRN